MDAASDDRSARLEHRILLRDNHVPYHRLGNPDPCPLRLLILKRAINRHHMFGFALRRFFVLLPLPLPRFPLERFLVTASELHLAQYALAIGCVRYDELRSLSFTTLS